MFQQVSQCSFEALDVRRAAGWMTEVGLRRGESPACVRGTADRAMPSRPKSLLCFDGESVAA